MSEFSELSISEIHKLLKSGIHEERLTALLLLVHRFKKGDPKEEKRIYNFFMKNASQVNNWDLVDLSAPQIVGAYLFKKDKSPLYELAKSSELWKRRISIVSTYYFIREGQLTDTFKIATDDGGIAIATSSDGKYVYLVGKKGLIVSDEHGKTGSWVQTLRLK